MSNDRDPIRFEGIGFRFGYMGMGVQYPVLFSYAYTKMDIRFRI